MKRLLKDFRNLSGFLTKRSQDLCHGEKTTFVFDILDNLEAHYPVLQKHVDELFSFFDSYRFILFAGKGNETNFKTLKTIPIFLHKGNVEGQFSKRFWIRYFNFLILLYNTWITVYNIVVHKPPVMLFLSYEGIFLPLLVFMGMKFGKVGLFVHYLPSNTSFLSNLRRKCLVFSISQADLVVVREDYVKNYLHLQTGFPEHKIAILPHIPEFAKETAEEQGYSKTTEKGINVIGFVGIIREDKGVFVLLEALKHLNAKGKMLKNTFKISGYPLSEAISKKIMQFSPLIPNLVVNLKFLDGGEYLKELPSVDILILPYKKTFGEGRLSGPMFDAIFCGKPIIASDFGIFAYYIKTYKIGWVFKPEDSLSLANLLINLGNSHEEYLHIKQNVSNLKDKLLNDEWKYENIHSQFKRFFF